MSSNGVSQERQSRAVTYFRDRSMAISRLCTFTEASTHLYATIVSVGIFYLWQRRAPVCVGSERRRSCFTCIVSVPFEMASYSVLSRLFSDRRCGRQKCSTDNKSTLELACLTGFQPRLSLFVYCNRFDNELKVRFRVISRAALSRDCSLCCSARRGGAAVFVFVWYVIVYWLTVDLPLSIHNCVATERLLNIFMPILIYFITFLLICCRLF